MKRIVMLIDAQNDFVSPKGLLSIKGADNKEIIDNINSLLNSDKNDYVIATQDWHPDKHVSFASTHNAEQFTTKQTQQRNKMISQKMWPNHCIAGTSGADIYSSIDMRNVNAILRKGNDLNSECYSLFEYAHNENDLFIDIADIATPHYYMIASLFQPETKEFIVFGYALDICVLQTAISATKLGSVIIVSDASAAVDSNFDLKTICNSYNIKISLTKDIV